MTSLTSDSFPPNSPTPVSRRHFLQGSAAATALASVPLTSMKPIQAADREGEVYQATGVRIGEVTPDSAIVWTRLTLHPQRNNDGKVFKKRGDSREARDMPVEQIEGACPGQPGKVRVVYATDEDFSDAQETHWVEVDAAGDFIHPFHLSDLRPGTTYHFQSETSAEDQKHAPLVGRFRTAPPAGEVRDVRFCVMTCQGYPDRDHEDGHPIYPSMSALDPDFISMTGDLIYYDNDAPSAVTADLARLHWQRMFSLPRLVATLRNCGTYWLKDDHDTLDDDSWPGQVYGDFTFEEGQKIFRQQAPLGDKPYRTFRWGKDVQIWLTDGRDFRSPNNTKDGPSKSIWGAEQKAWFKRTVRESDATWKILISPTPLVGPDRPKKNDNHANDGFAHEGNEIRRWIQQNVADSFFVICGDRHWQYHSVHPETGVQEFSVGAASNSHAAGTPGRNPKYHRFHKVQGGFLSVDATREGNKPKIAFRLRDVDGNVAYEQIYEREV